MGVVDQVWPPPSHRIRWNITPQGGIRCWWGLIWVILPKYLLVLSREWMGMGEWDYYSGIVWLNVLLMYFIGVDPSESSDNRPNVFAAEIIYLLSEVKQQVENTKLALKIQANISWVHQSEKSRSQRQVTQDLPAVSECDNPLCGCVWK